jgi:hypothetical protein
MTERDMEALIKALGVKERVLLFCLGSRTDWRRAGVTLKTVAGLVVSGLVTPTGGHFVLTNEGRAMLRALLRDL